MSGLGSLYYVVVDCEDPTTLAEFWSRMLGTEVVQRIDDQFVLLAKPEHGPGLAFQKVPEPKHDKNRLHLDLEVGDTDAATEKILGWGGSQVTGDQELGGHTWRVMADPEGNQFCI